MKLSTFSDYSLRVLIYLGLQTDRLATVSEITNAFGISRGHLMKVVHQLGRAGYLETVRGKGGGMRLGQTPERIVLGQVIRHTEGDIAMVECFSGDSHCRIQPACRLKAVLAEALAGMFKVLDAYTLADLLRQPEQLEAIIGRDIPGKR
ncbi:MAG TPA: Rrf2 family transcriptional regulator [Azospira sp.]|nr:Rrf2 family transcriptional regulator [Azospira sp.]